jgi:hypothetical protein
MMPYVGLAATALVLAFNVRGWCSRRARVYLIGMILTGASLLPWLFIIALNLGAGCPPWAPSVVEYHDGMTLCPGQSARFWVTP